MARSISQLVRSLPLSRKLTLIVLFFVGAVGGIVFLAHVQMQILAGVRAYVGGEASWSKGQKDAVLWLRRYAHSHDEADYQAYLASVAVPLGDHRALVALTQDPPDPETAVRGFVQGRNHPADAESMVELFRWFQHLPYMAEAVAIWSHADRALVRFDRAARVLHAEVRSGHDLPADVARALRQIDALNRRFTPREHRFSQTLEAGARRVETGLLTLVWLAAGVVVGTGVLLSWLMLRHLRESEERYHHLLETAADAILVTDVDTDEVVDANWAAAELLGWSIAELIGRSGSVLVPRKDRPRARAALARCVARGHVRSADFHVRHADGHAVPVDVSAGLTEWAGRRVIQWILRDITERRQAEEANARLVVELEDNSRLKSEFVSTMSHELRTPLNVVLGYAEMLRDRDCDLDQDECIARLQAAGRDLHDLIESTLEIGRIDAGRDGARFEPVELPALWAELQAGCSRLPRHTGVALEWDAASPPVSLTTDPRKLTVVMRNLVGNALKFTEYGAVRVDARVVGDALAIRVSDTGIGIPAAEQANIFDLFRQGDGSDTRRFGGSGLGLYIVRRFVRQLSGTVAVTSAPGKGSVFTVTLPMRDTPARAA